jgi:hypothetical protein
VSSDCSRMSESRTTSARKPETYVSNIREEELVVR